MASGNDWYKKKLIELREVFGNKCSMCPEGESPSPEKLGFAHIAPTGLKGVGRGRNNRVLDIMKNMDKYTLLCRKHHAEFDGFGYNPKA